ncbi:MAG: glycoside hydrolase, partial [Limisphaerales bacterium]
MNGINFSALIFLLLIPAAVSRGALWQTIVDETSFSSVAAFQSSWSYNYPWGADHNGSARMNATNVTVANGMVTLTSSLTNDYEGVSSSSPYLTIRYNSGTFYLKTHITIDSQYPVWDISGEFRVPTQTGAWPAFWMTGANSWPPESDFMEFKGGDGCNQNTYDGNWQSQITAVSTASTAWHAYRVVACLENSTNVDFHYYIDGQLK